MKPYRVVGDDPTFNILLHGEPGSGKTTLAASAQDHPKMKNVLFGNIEGGLLSVAHRGDIHAVDIKKTTELDRLIWDIIHGKYSSVRTIVIDSVTELQSINLEEIVKARVDKAESTGRTSRRGNKPTLDDIWQDDYQKSTVQLRRLFRKLKDLPLNVILTALTKFVYPKVPEGTDMSMVEPMSAVPMLTAKLSASLMGFTDMNWYCFKDSEDNKYKVLTTKHGPYHAKSRGKIFAKRIGDVVVDPHLGTLYDLFVKYEGSRSKKSSTE